MKLTYWLFDLIDEIAQFHNSYNLDHFKVYLKQLNV